MFDIGFLGGGQLARMSIQAAQRMGLTCLSIDPGAETPASQIAPALQGALDDPSLIAEIFRQCERVTLENEFIPAATIHAAIDLAGRRIEDLTPSLSSLETIQDKMTQRRALIEAGVPSPRALPIESGLPDLPFPMVLKARFGGYDGKGTRYARTYEEFESYRDLWGQGGWMAEEFVPFRRELAVMAFISDREDGCFPTMETIQTDHICDLVFPSGTAADDIAIAAVEAVGGVGLYGIELFELESGELLVNEMAPRPHNTGHYTLDWGGVSQFEQHIRLVMGMPVVTPSGYDTCMANLLGQPTAGDFRQGIYAAVENDPAIRVHWYGKVESRPGRKMGHLNAVGEDCLQRAKAARERFYQAWTQPVSSDGSN
ncbi:MAG TPA: ATP-grasp domain-containing protein [Fimbriimonadaceae bacterium]|nr:ATP-grasp domain-containing protein [Fimbriimonadaceae bacterium]